MELDRKRLRGRWTLRSLATGALVALTLGACGRDPQPAEAVRTVLVVQPGAVAGMSAEAFAGEVHARQESALAFRVGGNLVRRLVDAGEEVKQGQLLAELDPGDARLQAGALVAHPRDIDLGEVVPAIIHGMGQAERIRWSIAPEGRYARADPGLLDRVLGNVVENALRHHPADSPEPVRVDVGVRDGRVEIRVVDHGEGVPESQLDRIFRPFQRYGDHPQGEGTGLGLAIARGLAEAMGGTLLAETTPGGGLTLVLSLPLARGSDAAGAARKEDR